MVGGENVSAPTLEQIEGMLAIRDARLKQDVADMIKAELAPFKTAIQEKASHADVDRAVQIEVKPINDKVDLLFEKIEHVVTMVGQQTAQLAEVRGLATALTNIKGTQLDTVRERQTEMRQSLDLVTSAQANLFGAISKLTERVNMIFEDVRGVPNGQDGSPSLFAMAQTNSAQLGILTNTLNAFIIESRDDRRALRADNAAIMRRVDALEKTFKDARDFVFKTVRGGAKRIWDLAVGNRWKLIAIGGLSALAVLLTNNPDAQQIVADVLKQLGMP